MTPLRELAAYSLGYPSDEWGGWDVAPVVEDAVDVISSTLADSVSARQQVARSVRAVNDSAMAMSARIYKSAIWVPDPSTGAVLATMHMFLKGFGPEEQVSAESMLASRNLRKEFGRWTKVLDYSAATSVVSAGDLAVESVVLRRARDRVVQGYVYFTIFAPGAADALCLQFNTVEIGALSAIAEQGRVTAESVTLTLAEEL